MGVSELVLTFRVGVPADAGLMMRSNSMLTWSPGAIDAPLNRVQVAISPDLLQAPTAVLWLVTSTTDVFPSALVICPSRERDVIWLTAWRDSPPVAERRERDRVLRAGRRGAWCLDTVGWVIWPPVTVL